MKWNELTDVIHDNELDASDDNVIVYEFGTGDFHEADVIAFRLSDEVKEHVYISINNEEDGDE